MPPPPPPPPPPPGAGGPPPPPPPPGGLPGRPAAKGIGNRNALLSDIRGGMALKKTVTNDRSAPMLGKTSSSGGAAIGGAPPVPGAAPAIPKVAAAAAAVAASAPTPPGNRFRARSNSDHGSSQAAAVASMDAAPQLGGLFAGGMPKLKKRGGGVDTGAEGNASYLSDSETIRSKAPSFSAPRPPVGAAPSLPGRGPPVPPPAVGGKKPKPPPPVGKKPPPPPLSRKPSVKSTPPPPHSAIASAPSLAPPPPPPPPTSSAPTPSAPPPPPPPSFGSASFPAAVPPPPPPPSAAPPLPSISSGPRSQPSLPPPPPPSAAPSSIPPVAPAASAPSLPSQIAPQIRNRGSSLRQTMLDPSSYTLTANDSSTPSPGNKRHSPNTSFSGRTHVNDDRWHFKEEKLFPKPRDFVGGHRKYRAGRGSSIPLDLSAL